MDASPESPLSYVLWPTGAALIIAIFYRRGLLDRDVLEQQPKPIVPLTTIDLLPVAALWIVGAVAAASLHEYFNSTNSTTQPATSTVDPAVIKNLSLVALQIVIQLPLILFVFWALATRSPNKSLSAGLEDFGLIPPDSANPFHLVKMGLVALVTALPIVVGINQLSVGIGVLMGHHAPDVGHKLLDEFSGTPSTLAIAVLLGSVAFLAPVLEEFVYRGLLQSCLRGIGSRWQTVLIASAIFAGMHTAVVPLQVIPGLFALGIMLGWLYERTGSLWPGIILHCGFNLSNVVLYYLLTQAAHPTTQPAL